MEIEEQGGKAVLKPVKLVHLDQEYFYRHSAAYCRHRNIQTR
jgi:hypothetical protein